MLRILEMLWLAIALISGAVSAYQFFAQGWLSAVWMLVVTTISIIMYATRRRQRISQESDDAKPNH
jgi:uncharacterized membrane protein